MNYNLIELLRYYRYYTYSHLRKITLSYWNKELFYKRKKEFLS